MFDCLLKGFKIFASKKTVIIIILFLISMFGINYISNYIIDTIIYPSSLSELPTFLFNYYGYVLLFIVLGYFFAFLISNYVTYLISHTILKSKKDPKKAISSVFVYSLFLSAILLLFSFFIYLDFIIFKFVFISIILLFIIAISALVVSIVATLAIIFLPVSDTIKESFDRSWLFLKKKFWALLFLTLILGIINIIISYLFTYLLTLIFSNNYYLELIIQTVANTILSMYSVAVIAYFIKKKK